VPDPKGKSALSPLRRAVGWRGFVPVLAVLLGLSLVLSAMLIRDLSANSNMVEALSGRSEAYRSYADFRDSFDLGRDEEVLLVRSDGFGSPEGYLALEDLVLDLQLTDGVDQVLSIFSLPGPDGQTTFLSRPAIAALPPAARLADLREGAPYADRLLDAGATTTLIYLLGQPQARPGALSRAVLELAPLYPGLSLSPVGQAEVDRVVARALLRDQLVVTPLAIVICIAMSILALRSWRAALCCAAPPLVGLVWFLATLSATGTAVDPFLSIVPTILIVLGFADCMHLFYATEAARADMPARQALLRGMRETAPAAAMTSSTTAVAFVGFVIVGNEALSAFAFWGPFGLLLVFASFCLVFPLAYLVLFPHGTAGRVRPARFAPVLAAAGAVQRRGGAVRWLGVLLFLGLLPFLGRAEPVFSLNEHIRPTSPLGRDLAALEAAGLGNASLYLVVADADGEPGLAQADRDRIDRVAGIALGTTAPPLPDAALAGQDSRFIAASGLSYAFPLPLPLGLASEDMLARVAGIEARLAEAGLADAVSITGQSLLAARMVPEIIQDLRLAYYLAVAAVTMLIWLLLGSVRLALIATFVSVLPILAVEALLVLRGSGLTMTGTIALTLAFGIAVDDTIHFLNRFRLVPGPLEARLAATRAAVGPPMVGTTLILIAGLAATAFSAIPSLPFFGALVASAVFLALMADIFLLPCLAAWSRLK